MLSMVRGVRELGMEACVTAGMLSDQGGRLAEAGLTAYNHNLDTSPEHYERIISTRTTRSDWRRCSGSAGLGWTGAAAASSAWKRCGIGPDAAGAGSMTPISVPVRVGGCGGHTIGRTGP